MNLDIVRANDEDREWIADLMVRSEPWTILGLQRQQALLSLAHPEYAVYIAKSGGKRAGFLVAHPRGLASSPYIKTVAMAPEFRDLGYGAELMKFAENLFRSEARNLFLCVSSFNIRAQAFYARLGYLPVGVLKDYLIEGEAEIILHKRIG